MSRIKALFLLLCATILVGASAYAGSVKRADTSVRVGIFNSQKTAQKFFESLPPKFQKKIDPKQLWLNAYKSNSGLVEYYLDISALASEQADALCVYLKQQDTQCVISERMLLIGSDVVQNEAPPTLITKPSKPSFTSSLPRMLRPLGVRLHSASSNSRMADLNLALPVEPSGSFEHKKNIISYGDAFSLEPQSIDSLKAQAAKAAYETARNRFVDTLRSIGEGVNAGQGDEVARENLLALGQEIFETAGGVYLSGFLERELGQAEVLSSEAGAGKTFIHHVKQNLGRSAQVTVEGLLREVLSAPTSDEEKSNDYIKTTTDAFMLSGARGLIDAGLSAAKRSDLYALRNMELEYNINNFEDSYFSALITQPIYQSVDLRHNVFLQGGGILNEQSVDIDDDVARHTLNMGAAYRYLTVDEKYLIGANVFYDHQWPYNHSRVSAGVDAKAKELNLAANYYYPLTDFRDSRRDADGLEYEERALEGYDFEVGYTLPFLSDMSVFGKGYQYFRETDDDIRGIELSAEYNLHNNFTIKGSVVEENGGRDSVELALQYRMPLYDTEKQNLALAAMEPAAGSDSVREKIFEKVRRENRIRVEERLKAIPVSAAVITAQFNALSTGLPFDVGGVATGAGVNLPFDTAITVPNGDFGIIEFSNGAIANVSASGGGDVILEFNNTTLTVTATNGGFVQFISGSGGGISVVNVPGGAVNLLGTDIDVTDDGVTTTIQVRAGQIEVVPDVGVAVLGGNQAEVVSLTIATGATALLVDPALETRQEAAYTNLDLINPSPPSTDKSTPFINVAPALITGPQFVGNNADLRLTFTQGVTVGGAPFINGLVDANARTFAYDAGSSSSTQLVFRHVYVAGDVGAAAITINDLDLNGGTIIGTANSLDALTAFTPTVVAINDATAPMLTGSTPADNEPAFSSGSNIVLNFDENVQANIGNITLTDTTDGSDTRIIPIGDAQVTIVGSTVTIDPTGTLDLSTDYDLVIGADVIRDTVGNAFAGIATTELNFTTSNDVTPPALTGSTPADNDTEVARDANIVLTFDDNAVIGSGNITIHRTDDDTVLETIAVGSGNVTGGGTATITINPTTDFPAATEVYVLIPGTAFEDAVGNDFAGITGTTDLSFRTPSPLDVAGIGVWLDAADASSITLNSGNVAQWSDKSGNSNNATQATPGNQPPYLTDATGAYLSYTGSGSAGAAAPEYMDLTSSVNAKSIFFVTDYNDVPFSMILGTTANTFYIFQHDASYAISLDGNEGNSGDWYLNGVFQATGGNIGSVGDAGTSAIAHSIIYGAGDPASDAQIIGAYQAGRTGGYGGKIREIIIYDAYLNATERQLVENYLIDKWGL